MAAMKMSCLDLLLQKVESTDSPSCCPLDPPPIYTKATLSLGFFQQKNEHGGDINSCLFLRDVGLLKWVTLNQRISIILAKLF